MAAAGANHAAMLQRCLLVCGFIALAGCAALKNLADAAGIKPPEVKFDKVTYRAADFDALHCDVAFAVTNPNRVGGRISGYDMKLVVDGLTIADGKVEQPLDLGPGKTTTFIIPAVVKWGDVANRLTSRPSIPNDLPWQLTGAAHVKIADQDVALPFDVDGSLPVIKPPSINPVALRITKASFTNIGIAVDLEMRSNGGHPISIGELKHDVALSGQTILTGAIEPAGNVIGSTTRTLTADLSTLSVGMSLINMLQANKPVDVRLSGFTSVDTGFGIVPFRVDTTTKLAATK